MAKFDFKLHSVLRHREMVEQEKQRVFLVAQAERDLVSAEIRALDESVQKALADLRANHLTGSLNLAFLAGHRRFMLAMQRQGMELLQKREVKQKAVDAAQKDLAEAAKQKKLLEKLREKQEGRWSEALAKREMSALDEVAMQMSYQSAADEAEMMR